MKLGNVKAISFYFCIIIASYLIGLLHRGFSTQYDEGFSASIGLMIGGVVLLILATIRLFSSRIKKPKESVIESEGFRDTKLDLHKPFEYS